MTSPLRKRLQLLASVLSLLLVLLVVAAVFAYFQMKGSLPQLAGERRLAGLTAPVKIERDALGVPRITGGSRVDVARATGFVHAQDRFFQMDLLRRRAGGELAELFGRAALPVDQSARRHGFRRVATEVLARATPEQLALVQAYTEGVNAGLAALNRRPWEYLALRVEPAPWRPEDSVLCAYAMWLDLQDENAAYEQALAALHGAFGAETANFFAPRGLSRDSALDGSHFPPPELPPLRLRSAEDATTARLTIPDDAGLVPGSNSFAVDGTHSVTGAAIVANDMHLGLSVPNVWYRAQLVWNDATGAERRVVGVTLPGTPGIIVGSNGQIAWGFTNSYIDTVDAVVVETYADLQYRTPGGWKDIEDRVEVIAVKGEAPVNHPVRWTEWGPLISGPRDGRYLALRWTAHGAEAVNFNLFDLETARTATEAIAVAHRAGMPNQNLLVADRSGRIAWTVTGKVPQRFGYDGRLPVSWAYGDRGWKGWLPEADVPVIADPAAGFLWTANQRLVGGDAYAKLGDGGYDSPARGKAIEEELRQLLATKPKVDEANLLAVQLSDRAVYLQRWQELLLTTLDDAAVAAHSTRREMRELARAWEGHASVESAGYRLIRGFRTKVFERTLAPFLGRPQGRHENFNFNRFMTEDAVWRLVTEKPARLLNPDHRSWESLLLAAADDVIADAEREGTALARFTWGARNTLRMQHPFGRFLPGWLARLLDMPAEQLPGDSNLPRVQARAFGASERLVVSPGHEDRAIFHMPGGQSGHPLSPFYRAGHDAWVKGEATPLLPGPTVHTLTLAPGS